MLGLSLNANLSETLFGKAALLVTIEFLAAVSKVLNPSEEFTTITSSMLLAVITEFRLEIDKASKLTTSLVVILDLNNNYLY